MKRNGLVTELQKELHESQNERDRRIEELWRRLNPSNATALDLKALQKGLRRIDHPLANADRMLQKIMETVDTNGDGKIQYEGIEFHTFVDQAEGPLLNIFRSVNTAHDGKLEKKELHEACRRAGVAVPMRRLDTFFSDIDLNKDGYITFEEWRDFLLFMPAYNSDETLNAILSFYSLTSEGDSLVSDETLEGLGTSRSLLYILFGSIIRLLQPEAERRKRKNMAAAQSPDSSSQSPEVQSPAHNSLDQQKASTLSQGEQATITSTLSPSSTVSSSSTSSRSTTASPDVLLKSSSKLGAAGTAETPSGNGNGTNSSRAYLEKETAEDALLAHSSATAQGSAGEDAAVAHNAPQKSLWKLTDFVPDPGYFLAGAIAGGVSRTATAPLDRLKVYLLVNTSTSHGFQDMVGALKGGHVLKALGHATTPFRLAVRDLWLAGGAKTFFAGNGLNVIKIMPETAIKFGSYEAAKRAMASFEGHSDPRNISPYSKFAAGGVAGMISQFCVYPLDTLKFRLQCETTKDGLKGNALVIQTARKMFADGGFRAAYRGVTMGLVGMFPYSAIDMGTFEFLKTSYKKYKARKTGTHPDDVVMGNLVTGVIGASSGAFGASIVYPLNVLRTRLQTQGTVMHRETYTGIVDVARKTVQREGYRGLYKGITPNLLKVAPALSITWMVYEKSKRVLGLD
ncbi:hypothetical protein jhhlp_000421 [Lomentospora prolificans]|uniref:Mitochondrial thiamine pyrophosphate carrier 1 n=1 Tax=Lomentospora prolificans TaxID=41688 RepID=A0A2N3NKX2_9PEZI|nr:hypothetical protein jhhlp_000421 [Lomentospora prolificans]